MASLADMYSQKLTIPTQQQKPQPIKEPVTKSSTPPSEKEIDEARDAFISFMMEKANGFANLNQEAITNNFKRFKDGSDADRRIYYNRLSLILVNFALIEMALVTMVEFRRLFVNVVRQEMLLDILPARKVKMIRNQLRVPKYDPDDEFNIYGKDKFSPQIYRRFIEVVKESYSSLRPEDRGFEVLLSSLSKEVRDDLGFVCSNYGYALRAMALNDSFMVELASIIYAYSNLDALEAETSAL